MELELLVIADCPNETAAALLLRTALNDVGLTHLEFATTVIETAQEAQRRGFIGSPTVLIDGKDPFAEHGQTTGLACRVYRGTDGLSGVPDLTALRQALKRAAREHIARQARQ